MDLTASINCSTQVKAIFNKYKNTLLESIFLVFINTHTGNTNYVVKTIFFDQILNEELLKKLYCCTLSTYRSDKTRFKIYTTV